MELENSPIPLIIYRVHHEEAYWLGVLVDSASNVQQLSSYNAKPQNISDKELCKQKPIAALSNDEGIQRSEQERALWLLHPQLQELQLYRGQPKLFALHKSHGFYEAYIPYNSSPLAYEWYSEEQLRERQLEHQLSSPDALPEYWLNSPEQEGFLGHLLKHLFFWQNGSILCASSLASLQNDPNKSKGRKDKASLQKLYEQFYSGSQNPKPHISQVEPQNISHDTAKSPAGQISYPQSILPLQNRYPKNFPRRSLPQNPSSPAQDWLNEAQQAIAKLQTQGRSKEQQGLLLAQSLWALFGFWVSSHLRPENILRKLRLWLQLEQQHQEWEAHRLQAKAEPPDARKEER